MTPKSSSASKTKEEISLAKKAIALRPQKLEEAKRIEKGFKLSPIASRILAARGFKAEESLKNYIEPSLKEGLSPPENLKGLKEAAKLIAKTLKSGGKIAISCDFDVDGLSGGAQVYHFLKTLGANVSVFVPDRFVEGYGLSSSLVDRLIKEKFELLIAIDFGTTNQKELEHAKKNGIKTIVIDHHHVGSNKSPADVFINPHQEGCGFGEKLLCASGLSWYLLIALRSELKKEAALIDPKAYLDLACLGTICDMVPLLGINRIIAKRGLELLTMTERPGLRALKAVAGVNRKVSCYDVSFGLGPRINAAGRMVHGDVVIELLTTGDAAAAEKIASRLNRLNLERQDTEAFMKETAVQMVMGKEALPSGIVVWREDFHTGVVGIVAQRLVEAFYRPSAVIGREKEGILKGSVRGIKGVSVVEILSDCSSLLLKYGGHEGAGGFSLEEKHIQDFEEVFAKVCAEKFGGKDPVPSVEADTEVLLSDICHDLVSELENFAPFGVGNPGPQLLLKGLKVLEVKEIKGAHVKATLTDGKLYIPALLWRQRFHPALRQGAKVDVVAKADTNLFNGMRELQLSLQAVEQSA